MKALLCEHDGMCVSNVNFVLISNGQQLHHLLVCLLFAICLGVTWDHEQQLKIAGICIFHFILFFSFHDIFVVIITTLYEEFYIQKYAKHFDLLIFFLKTP